METSRSYVEAVDEVGHDEHVADQVEEDSQGVDLDCTVQTDFSEFFKDEYYNDSANDLPNGHKAGDSNQEMEISIETLDESPVI